MYVEQLLNVSGVGSGWCEGECNVRFLHFYYCLLFQDHFVNSSRFDECLDDDRSDRMADTTFFSVTLIDILLSGNYLSMVCVLDSSH